MPVLSEQPRRLVVRDLLSGVVVGRIAGDGPLLRAVIERYGTSIHLAGRSQWASGRARWASSPGTVSVKVPGDVTIERSRSGSPDHQNLLFDASLVEDARAALDRPVFEPREHALHARDPRARPLAELHRQVLANAPKPALEEALCVALAAFVDITFAPRGTAQGPSAFSVAVARARALLDERLTETVSLDALAAHARLDKFHLCRAFRDQVGLAPHAYVTHRRVSRAQELLARGIAQAEVAASVGLYDQSHLHHHFKRIVGLTPGAFTRAAR